ncbi:hypothetical protein V6N13_118138 [Hibiscus sabdariffa]|uniref:Uncharacterized protein n=1 Tax=Hibiscus sabdariffa TaxID=183260 RepID=A0ABR2Q8N3_9ROSI
MDKFVDQLMQSWLRIDGLGEMRNWVFIVEKYWEPATTGVMPRGWRFRGLDWVGVGRGPTEETNVGTRVGLREH